MRKNAISFFRVSKAVLVFLSLALFLIAPSVDNIACNDCATPFQEGDSSNHLCSYCFNSVGMVNHDIFHVPLMSTPMDTDGPMTAFSGPAFPIYKPPQN
jgi:hypothetical protein